MASEKTTAIVLRVIEFSETSVIATLMTRDFGKITAMAKGARRPKSPFEAALDVLAICRVVFLHKTSGAMSLLTEAKLDRRFRSAAKNINRLYAAYYVVELLNQLTDEGDPHPELYELAESLIIRLDTTEISSDGLNLEVLQFELEALKILGHQPMLTQCVSCARKKSTQSTNVSFGLNAGGILCGSCRKGKQNVVNLSSSSFQYLLTLTGGELTETENENAETTDPKNEPSISNVNGPSKESSVPPEVRRLVNRYITHLLGYPPKLHKFLQNI